MNFILSLVKSRVRDYLAMRALVWPAEFRERMARETSHMTQNQTLAYIENEAKALALAQFDKIKI